MIIEGLEIPYPGPAFESGGYARKTVNRRTRLRALRSLALVSEGTRKLAQPLIFRGTSLNLHPDRVRHISQALCRLFEARHESTAWLKSLHLNLETWPPLDADGLSAVTTLLPHLTNIHSLLTLRLYDIILQAPLTLFETLTEVDVAEAVSAVDFLATICRCPNLVTLKCPSLEGEAAVEIPSGAVSRLSSLHGPIQLAKLLLPGRPVETLTITLSQASNQPLSTSLAELTQPLTSGTKLIRSLEVVLFEWTEGCMHRESALLPCLERLALGISSTHKVGFRFLRKIDRSYTVGLGLAGEAPR